MSLNVHGLVHQAENVRLQGDLGENSCFGFEDTLGHMKKMVHGTQHLDKQVATITYMFALLDCKGNDVIQRNLRFVP